MADLSRRGDMASVPVHTLEARYVVGATGRARLLPLDSWSQPDALTAEDFAARHYASTGHTVMRCEGGPFTALYEAVRGHPYVNLYGAEPFTPSRLSEALPANASALWAACSRQPPRPLDLGAVPAEEERLSLLAQAAVLFEMLGRDAMYRALCFLDEDLNRRAGWPDLLVWRAGTSCPRDARLVEVKSDRDKMQRSQSAWFEANDERLHLPVEICRITRVDTVPVDEDMGWPWQPPILLWEPNPPTSATTLVRGLRFAEAMLHEYAWRRDRAGPQHGRYSAETRFWFAGEPLAQNRVRGTSSHEYEYFFPAPPAVDPLFRVRRLQGPVTEIRLYEPRQLPACHPEHTWIFHTPSWPPDRYEGILPMVEHTCNGAPSCVTGTVLILRHMIERWKLGNAPR